MPTLRERLVRRVLKPELEQIDQQMRIVLDAYARGPFEELTTPEALLNRLTEQGDSAVIQDMIHRVYWEQIGTMTGYGADGNAQRTRAVDESRRQWRWDVIAQQIIWLWTNYGFGEDVIIRTEDPDAQKTWDEFWKADRNQSVLAADKIHQLSHNLLRDGELFFPFFVSTTDGQCKIRTIDPKEIVGIVTEREDRSVPMFYHRVWGKTDGGSGDLYYPDWLAALNAKPGADTLGNDQRVMGKVSRAVLEDGAKVAGSSQTNVLMLPVFHNVKDGLRGWPLMAAGAAWTRAHKQFRENRASVSAAIAMYVNKLKANTGSRGIDALRAQIQSSMVTSGLSYETNPAAPAGSTWLENEGADLSRLSLSTAAGDAKVDGDSLLMMAGTAGGVYPHYLGAGDSFRLATACYSDDTEVLTENGWKSWRDWSPGEKIATYNRPNREIQYREPTALRVYDYEGEMYRIKGKSIDALVTPNHRMLVKNENPGNTRGLEVYRADELPCHFALPTYAHLEEREPIEHFILPGYTTEPDGLGFTRQKPDRILDMDMWLRFLGWWLAEGSIYYAGYGGNWRIEIVQNPGEDADDIQRTFEGLPFNFRTGVDKRHGTLRWYITDKALYLWLEANCGKGAANKRVPSFVFALDGKQAGQLLERLWRGDGTSTKGDGHHKKYKGCLSSTSRQLIDDAQVLMLHMADWGKAKLSLAAGKNAGNPRALAIYNLNRGCYLSRHLRRRDNVRVVSYSGKVWCFEAPPNKMFITRRNGCPLIAGNTAMESPMFRMFSRYQSFWAAQFRKMVRIVLETATKYGGQSFTSYGAMVSTDRLVESDLVAIAGSIHNVIHAIFVPAVENGLMPKEVAQKILASLWRIVLEALQVRNAVDIASDEAFMEPGDPVVQVAQAVQRNVEEGRTTEAEALKWTMRELEMAQRKLEGK